MNYNADAGFRIQGKYLFLTYPHANFDIDEYWDFIVGRLGRNNVVQGIICRELHADGSDHRHVAIELRRRFDSRNPRVFDYSGFHGNYQQARSWAAVKKYCKKGEDWKGYGQAAGSEENPDDSSGDEQTFEGKPHEICYYAEQCQGDKKLFLSWCLSKQIPHGYFSSAWNMVYDNKAEVFQANTPVPGTILLPYLSFLAFENESRRALVLQGPTGIGKTTWAIRNAPKPCILVSQMDDLKSLDPSIKCIIFDDMDFKHMPRTSQIHMVDFDRRRAIYCRYGNAVIPAGMHKIFTCNEFPFVEDPAIRRRINVVDLYNMANA